MSKINDFGMISVIVPVYNAEKYIKRCIESVLLQSYSNIELILVDDGSKDNSYEICKQYAETDSRVSLFRQKNKGAAIARNKGLDNAKGNCIGFVDSDDCISHYMFENLMSILQQNDADMVDSKAQVFYDERALLYYKNRYDKLEVSVESKIINDRTKMFSSFFNMQDFQWSVCTKLFKENSIGKIRFNGHNGEDTKFMLKFIEQNNKFVSVTNKYYFYNKGNLKSFTQNFSIKSIDILEYYKLFAEYLKQYGEERQSSKCIAKYYILMLNYYSRIYFSNSKKKEIYLNEFRREINEHIEIIMKNDNISLFHKIDFYLFNKNPILTTRINYLIVRLLDSKRSIINYRNRLNEETLMVNDSTFTT